MNILALDDEEKGLAVLKSSIEACAPLESIHLFQDYDKALAFVKTTPIDVAFLDIHIKGKSGIDFAYQLKRIYKDVNIIFTTDYSEFLEEAFLMHASGYLTKPITPNKIKEELENLRYKPEVKYSSNKIFIKTFGNFDIIAYGKPVQFKRNLSKEVLAYLVDKAGHSVTRMELADILFGDSEYTRKTQDYLSKIIKEMISSLKNANCLDILIRDKNSYAVDKTKFKCDSYEFLEKNPEAINLYQGVYMGQYVWGEDELYKFEEVNY